MTHKLTAIRLATLHTTRRTHSRSTTQTTITICPRCLAAHRTITSRWVLDRILPAHSTPISNGPKARMDSTGTNGLLPPSPLRRAMFARECILPIIRTNTRGHPSHHHITLILRTRVIRDQSRRTTITRKRVERGTGVMVVRQVTFHLQDLASGEVRLGTSMELVEGVPGSRPLAFRSALVVR